MLDANEEVKLTLTAADCQVVLAGLGELPLKVSALVFEKVRQQIATEHPDAFGPQPQQPMINGSAEHLQ